MKDETEKLSEETKVEREVLEEARQEFEIAETADQENHELAAEDVRFRNGQQWPDHIRQERKDSGRPMLTINLMEEFVDDVTGEMRANRPSIKIKASGKVPDVPSVSGDKSYTMAQVYEGLTRDIEYQSKAEVAYDQAGDHAAGHGFGFLLVTHDYKDEQSFEQDIRIKRVKNSFSVHLDPNAEEPDKSDAEYGFISGWMPKKTFERTYPGKLPVDIEASMVGEAYASWYQDEKVRVASYYKVYKEKRVLVQLSDGRAVFEDQLEGIKDELAEGGVEVVEGLKRDVMVRKVVWRKISGDAVLEGPETVPSRWIPIVPVYGKELFVDGRSIYRGVVRHAKDPQRMFNYWRTAGTELVALAPKNPWVVADKTIEGYEKMWKKANTSNQAFLKFKAIQGMPAPRREPPAPLPTGILSETNAAAEDMKRTAGSPDPSRGVPAGEQSGKLFQLRQAQAQVGQFAYLDNLAHAIEHVGRIIVDMIPKIYDTERVVRMRMVDGNEDEVRINKLVSETIEDEEGKGTERERTLYDVSAGRYEVKVDTGPSYATQRQQAADTMLAFAQALPQKADLFADRIAYNMDWPEADLIGERLEKTLPPGIREKTQEEEDAPPSPEEQLAQKALEAKDKELDASLKESEAKIAKAEADKAEAEAKLALNSESPELKRVVAEILAKMMRERDNEAA